MKIVTDQNKVHEVLERGTIDVIEKEHLRTRMLSGEQLRIKFGIDPTSPHIHLGHTVPLRKLRQFQDLGHQAVLIIGDATGMIGDPTGRTESRKQLSREEIDENKKTYIAQAGKVIDIKKTEIRHNSEWFFPMSAEKFLGLTSLVTVQQVMQREDFRRRVDDAEHPLTTIEITYPIMQGYDSVMVRADVEIGGSDQLLNLHMGRRLQHKYNIPRQDILTVPLIEGTDGIRKMSKSFGNAIALEAPSDEMYAQTMSVVDELIIKYFTLLSDLSLSEIRTIEDDLQAGSNPRDAKARFAWELVRMYHSKKAADQAAETFDRLFRSHEVPEDMLTLSVVNSFVSLVDALVSAGFVNSKGEARRQIEQGGVKVDGKVVKDITTSVAAGSVIQKGKRFFVRIVQK